MPRGLLHRPIFSILLLALALRLWGIAYALPQFFVNDERAGVYGALKMMELKTLVPAWASDEFEKVLNYLPLPSYLYLLTLTPAIGIGYLFSSATNVAAYRELLTLDPTPIFLTARVTVAFIGVADVAVAYLVGKRLFRSERAGLLAALFLAVSFYHVQLSHVTRHWMPAALAVSLVWLAALEIYRRGSARAYLFAGGLAGLGVGANTAAAVAMVPAVVAHLLRSDGNGFISPLRDLRLWAMMLLFLAVSLLFIGLYPYGLTQGEIPGSGPAGALGAKVTHLASKSPWGWFAFLWVYVKLLARYETMLLAAAVVGVLLAWPSHRVGVGMAVAFIAAYLTSLYLFFNVIPRGVLFILPILAVFAGYGVDRLLLWLQSAVAPTRVAFYVLCSIFFFLFFGWPLALSLRYDYLLTKTDTRILAAEWLYQRLPAGAKVLANLPSLRLTNTKEGIRRLERIDPAGLRIQDRVLLGVADERYPEARREVLNLHFVSPESPYRQARNKKFFTDQGYRFLAVEYEYVSGQDLDPQARSLLVQGRRVQRFDGSLGRALDQAIDISGEIDTIWPWELFRIERFGQIVEVYEL